MNSGIENLTTNKQLDVNKIELTNTNHIDLKTNETDQTFRKKNERKINDKSLIEYEVLVSDEEKKPLIREENTEKNSTDNEKNLDETLEKLKTSEEALAKLEESKKNIEEDLGKIESFQKGIKEDLGKIESFQKGIEEADAKLKRFEESWKIGKFITGWKESTKLQKALTFAKIAVTVTVAISTALIVLPGGGLAGLAIALLVAALSIGLLHYFAKDVINIAKEKLTSARSEAYKKAMNFECEKMKDTSDAMIQTTEKIKTSLDGCKNDLKEQKKHIGDLRNQIGPIENSIKEEIKNKDDEIKKQKEKIAEITNNLARTISSSLTNSAQVEEKTKSNISLVEKAEKEIALIEGACSGIARDSQEIKKLSDGITNQIKNFNKKTVNKLKKLAGIDIETEDDGAVFKKSKLSRLLSEEETTKNNTEKPSEKIDDPEDGISKKKLNKFYLDKKFSAEKSEGSNETIKKLIDKISSSNVDPTKFAKLLTEIVDDQNKMNKAIMESSTKISKLAEKIEAEYIKKGQDFCTKIADTLATVKANEKTLLDMQKNHKRELISNLQKILTENFLTPENKQKLEALKEKFKDNKSFFKVFNFVFPEEEKNQDFGEDEILIIKEIINDKELVRIKPEEVTKITNVLDILGNIGTTIKSIDDINDKCTENISEIQNKDIKDVKNKANEINGSIKNLQNFSEKLNVEIINKSAHIVTTSAGVIIGGTAVGVLGTTVGLPVTLVSGGAVLLGTALYKIIKHYKSDKN